jgi:hypothetical protein
LESSALAVSTPGSVQYHRFVSVAGPARSLNVEGFGAPAGATAVVLNVTAITPTVNTFLTVFPSGSPPTTSDLNPRAGITTANLVVAAVGPGGTVEIFNDAGTVNVAVDLEGWYQ